mgnify:CR=1 FL=1
MDLFEYMSMQRKKEESPLAVRMRPKNLDSGGSGRTAAYYRKR